MNKISLSFLLTFIAGFSTMLGLFPILIRLKNENKIIAGSLAFASGVMLSVSITDLIPESLIMLRGEVNDIKAISLSVFFIILGNIFSSFLENKIGKKNDSNLMNNNKRKENTSLYKVGIISMLAIIMHNIPEGIATFISTTKDTALGISLTIAIAMHNIPEGISIAVPIYYSTGSKNRAILYTFISALSEPLGALITYLFLLPLINNTILGLLFSLIAGIMLNISLFELLPTSKTYNEDNITKIFFIIGIIFMLIKFIF